VNGVSRRRSEFRDKAFSMWERSGRTMRLSDIAKRLGISPSLVRKWKHLDAWDARPRRKRGGQPGNQNAVGNRGGGAPPGNKNAWKHGMYESLWMSQVAAEHKFKLMKMETDPREILVNEIRLLELREHNALKYMNDILNGWDAEQTEERYSAYKEEVGERPEVKDGALEWVPVTEERLELAERKIKKQPVLERLLAIENALSMIQSRKIRCIQLLDQFDRNELTTEELKLRIEKMQLERDKLRAEVW
jgi:uncharacterized protein YjcR